MYLYTLFVLLRMDWWWAIKRTIRMQLKWCWSRTHAMTVFLVVLVMYSRTPLKLKYKYLNGELQELQTFNIIFAFVLYHSILCELKIFYSFIKLILYSTQIHSIIIFFQSNTILNNYVKFKQLPLTTNNELMVRNAIHRNRWFRVEQLYTYTTEVTLIECVKFETHSNIYMNIIIIKI